MADDADRKALDITTNAQALLTPTADAITQSVEAAAKGKHGAVGLAIGTAAVDLASKALAFADETEEVKLAKKVLGAVSAGTKAASSIEKTVRAIGRAASGPPESADGSGGGGAEARTENTPNADARRAVDATLGAEDSEITLEFESSGDPDRALRAVSVALEECLGRPFHARIHVAAERTLESEFVRVGDLVGHDVTLTIARGETQRTLHGLVRSVTETNVTATSIGLELDVVPALAMLAQQVDSRVFFGLRVPEILDAVLGSQLEHYARHHEFASDVDRGPREYCVQYQESDLDFVHRLLEEEGLTYYFDHSGNVEVMHIVETNEGFPGLPGDALPITRGARGNADRDAIVEMREGHRLVSTHFALSDHDWRIAPTGPIAHRVDADTDPRNRERAVYDHSRGLTLGEGAGQHDASRQARVRHELLRRDANVASGRATALLLSAGTTFTTHDEREQQTLDERSWLVTKTSIRARDPRAQSLGAASSSGDAEERYACDFEAIPAETPYRPDRATPKPRIYGLQTAVVVGPRGQPIYSDEHRRVRVRFHWDRYRPNNAGHHSDEDRHTCWVRVSQAWAGFGYGALFLPRVGMEVVVSFLDGDPDRPLVTGCVYNGENPPPYQSEEEWTVSTLKTLTVDGSDLGPGFNELRFEDRKGKEQVYVQAERDLDELVKHDHSTRVRRHQRNTVDGNHTERVGGDQTLTVKGYREKLVEEYEKVTIKKNQETTIEGHHDNTVFGNQLTYVDGTRDVHVTRKDSEVFVGGREITVDQFDNLRVTANKNVQVEAQYNVRADAHFHLEQGAQSLHLGNHHIALSSDGVISLRRGNSQLVIDDNGIHLVTDGSIYLRSADCHVALHQGRVVSEGAQEVKMRCGESVVKAGTSYAEVNAPNVSVESSQITSVTAGLLVRIN